MIRATYHIASLPDAFEEIAATADHWAGLLYGLTRLHDVTLVHPAFTTNFERGIDLLDIQAVLSAFN